jgi:hypothetical protein
MQYAALDLLVKAGNKLTGANIRSGNRVCQFTSWALARSSCGNTK